MHAGTDKTKTYSSCTTSTYAAYFADTSAASEIAKTPAPTSTIP